MAALLSARRVAQNLGRLPDVGGLACGVSFSLMVPASPVGVAASIDREDLCYDFRLNPSTTANRVSVTERSDSTTLRSSSAVW